MKLWILSDLHLHNQGEVFEAPEADVCVVAGDVLEGVSSSLLWLSENIGRHMPVVFVAGNHEHYGSTVPAGLHNARSALKAGLAPNVHLLENEALVLDGVRFVGSTLWTDYRLQATAVDHDAREREVAWAMTAAERMLADHQWISVGDGAVRRRFTPSDAGRLHTASLEYLREELAKPFEGATVVVTHHAPHPGSVSEQFAGSPLNPAFASDLTEFILGSRPELWVHGHVHSCHDYLVGETRVVCNPRGYVRGGNVEDPDFNRRLVVEVEKRPASPAPLDPAWLELHAEDLDAAVRDQIGLHTYRVLARAPVLWSGWECDYDVVAVELGNGTRELVTLTKVNGLTRAGLLEKLAEYKAAAAATLDLLRVLEGQDRDESRPSGDSSR